jgi:hypothetical protein
MVPNVDCAFTVAVHNKAADTTAVSFVIAMWSFLFLYRSEESAVEETLCRFERRGKTSEPDLTWVASLRVPNLRPGPEDPRNLPWLKSLKFECRAADIRTAYYYHEDFILISRS